VILNSKLHLDAFLGRYIHVSASIIIIARKSVILAAIHNIVYWTATLTLAVTNVFAFNGIVIARTNDSEDAAIQYIIGLNKIFRTACFSKDIFAVI